ncbi:peptidase inhibitor family I36 protein [Streptomyces spectabilis]|uniref:Peptidase inhibitor family I36 protein n=1 Tax=Streptomyces spectabilis TaxID=68270 RepID=A0A516RI67_STRST|nr:peptidase inhibitor family I36 protein [Streptomyces spectabilis]QDQ15356.1 hypothetical protein FH965_36315 [Streptomyces spectabilis]
MAVASSALLLGGLAVVPASAGDSSGGGSEAAALTCASGDACFWGHDNYLGARGRVSGNNPDYRYHSRGRGDEVPNFAAPRPVGYNDPAFNDTISSNHWCTPR